MTFNTIAFLREGNGYAMPFHLGRTGLTMWISYGWDGSMIKHDIISAQGQVVKLEEDAA